MHNDSITPERLPAGLRTHRDSDLAARAGVVQAVAGGARDLKEIARLIGTTRSTTHRLASCLVEERYLRIVPQVGYLLGPKLIELGFQAREEVPLAMLARPYLDRLSELTGDTVHLAVREGTTCSICTRIPVAMVRKCVRGSGIGCRWCAPVSARRCCWTVLSPSGSGCMKISMPSTGKNPLWPAHEQQTWEQLKARREEYVEGGYAFDLEDNEPSIRCVAAPVRDASKQIVAGISVASTVPYMPLEKMAELVR